MKESAIFKNSVCSLGKKNVGRMDNGSNQQKHDSREKFRYFSRKNL